MRERGAGRNSQEPWKAVEQAGGKPELVSVEDIDVQAFSHLDKARPPRSSKTVADISAADYDGLVLTGGVANPDFLRTDEGAVAFDARVIRSRRNRSA